MKQIHVMKQKSPSLVLNRQDVSLGIMVSEDASGKEEPGGVLKACKEANGDRKWLATGGKAICAEDRRVPFIWYSSTTLRTGPRGAVNQKEGTDYSCLAWHLSPQYHSQRKTDRQIKEN